MANPEHLEILKQGVEVWNEWRIGNSVTPDLEEADLNNANLHSYVLTGSNLRRAQLREANLVGAALQGAVLYNADLLRANFSFAQLNSADLRATASNGVNFQRANLIGADLTWSDLVNVNFTWADLSNADLTNAQLGGTVFGHNDLSTVKGLDTVRQLAPSAIGIGTIYESRNKISEVFLRGCGVPDNLIAFAKSLFSPIEFYSCFISYSSEDEEFARRIYADLQATGIRAWFAPENLKAGDRFRDEIDSAIRVHDKLILVLSERSIHSNWVHSEIRKAIEIERETQRTILFPISIDNSVFSYLSHLPENLMDRQILDFSQWRDRDRYITAMSRLAKALTVSAASEMPEDK